VDVRRNGTTLTAVSDGESSLDARLLGLRRTAAADRVSFSLVPHLCRPDGALYGGTAVAAACAAMELVTGRPTLWVSVQLVSSAQRDDEVDVHVEVVAAGRRIDQVRLSAMVDGRLVFAAVGSAATPKIGAISGTGPRMPLVAPPDPTGGPLFGRARWDHDGETGHHRVAQFVEAARLDDGIDDLPGHVLMWARLLDETTTTAAKLGFLADMVPVAVCRAAGVMGAGTSLDNSLRIGHLVDSEWVLLELQGHVAADGYGYGDVRLWSPDGTLLGSGSQTAKLFSFDERFGT
jgi:acyl-CoA thioesterase-2